MKIDPFLRSVPLSPLAPSAITTRFADLIAAPADGASSADAFAETFSARGMFGRYGVVETPSMSAPCATWSAPPDPTERASSALPVATVVSSEPPVVHEHASATPTTTPRMQVAPALHAYPAALETHTSVQALLTTSPGAAYEETLPPESMRRPNKPPAAEQPSTASLLLGPVHANGSADVVVRAVAMDANEAARFRSRAEALLREHGITLDKVRLNGEGYSAPYALGKGTQSWR